MITDLLSAVNGLPKAMLQAACTCKGAGAVRLNDMLAGALLQPPHCCMPLAWASPSMGLRPLLPSLRAWPLIPTWLTSEGGRLARAGQQLADLWRIHSRAEAYASRLPERVSALQKAGCARSNDRSAEYACSPSALGSFLKGNQLFCEGGIRVFFGDNSVNCERLPPYDSDLHPDRPSASQRRS